MDTVQEIQTETETPVVQERKKPGPKPRILIDTNAPTSGDIEPITLKGPRTDEDPNKVYQDRKLSQTLEEFAGVVELVGEGSTNGLQNLGTFQPPEEFDLNTYAAAYAIEDAGKVVGWPSIGQLEQPTRHTVLNKVLVLPPWKVWKGSDGKPHKVNIGLTNAVLMYQPKANLEAVQKGYENTSKGLVESAEQAAALSYERVADKTLRNADKQEDAIFQDNLIAAIAATQRG